MKYSKQFPALFLGGIAFVLSLAACSNDDSVEITPKTLDQYKQEFGQYVNAELRMLDTCKVGYRKGDFAQVSTTSFATYKAAYLTALKADSAIIVKQGVTVAELIAANGTLATPGKAFWGKINISNRSVLNDSIVAATTLNTATLVGTGAGNVLNEAKTTFTTAIAAAVTTRDASTSIDRQVKTAIETLSAAKASFKSALIPATIDAYVQSSKSYVSAQKTLVQGCTVGFNVGEYLASVQTPYLTALTTAETTLNTTGVTYAQVAAAMDALSTPRKAFVPNVSDRRSLNDSIGVAETLNNATVVGTASGQVSQSTKTSFTTAISTAKGTRDNPLSTDGTCKSAAYTMGQAIQSFKNARIK